MLVLFALLVIGLVPTTTAYWPVATWTRWSRPIQGTSAAPGFPVRCFWTADKNSGPDWVVGEAVISYISLVGSYVWNLARFFDTSRGWIRLWGRCKLETAMEEAMRRQVRCKSFGWSAWLKYRAVMQCYFTFVVVWEVAESFMTTICILVFVLAWGSVKLIVPVTLVPLDVREAERQMGFGQILPLLLLLQPALAVVAFWVGMSLRSAR